MQSSIKCFYPTKGMMKEAELLSSKGYNIDTIGVSVLHSIYTNRSNSQKSPSINDLIQLIEENKNELNSFKYAVPYYIKGNNVSNPKDLIVEAVDSKFVLHPVPDNITVKDILDTWTAVPNNYKSVIETKKDLYIVELWSALLRESGDSSYNIIDNPNAGLNSYLQAINKLKEYKSDISNTEDKGYIEVESLKNNQLGSTHKDSKGNIVIELKKYISVDEFFDYLTGKVESPTSKQKELVLEQMEKEGVSLSMMQEKLNTPEKIKEFLYLHELNHVMNYNDDIKNYNREDYSAQVNVDIETRANMAAWNEMFGNTKVINNTTMFSTSNSPYYQNRTRDNANWSDITLALAINFNTRGEKLTKDAAGDKYISNLIYGNNDDVQSIIENLYNQLKSKGKMSDIKLNIAGNGIYSLPGEQSYYNDLMTAILTGLLNKGITIKEIRSGGQTGIDEAGIIAAQRLGIPNSVRATSDFKFRDKDGRDIADEKAFKSRFMQNIETNLETNELPEIGKPFYNTEAIVVDKEGPRAILAREMSYAEILDRSNMIARDFSTILDEEIEDLRDELEDEINNETDPLSKLGLSERLNTINDPVKGRREVINSLGIEAILDRIKERYQNWIDLSDDDINFAIKGKSAEYIRESYSKVLNNFDILFDEASTTIESNEKLRIIRESNEAHNSDEENTQENLDGDENGSKVHGNEGYTFKIRFVDPHDSARAETRKALSDIIQVDSEGNPILNDLGNTVYMREDFVHSTLLSILSTRLIEPDDFSIKDSEGNYHFPILEEMIPSYPWISQVINKLAYDPRLISIFYTDFIPLI